MDWRGVTREWVREGLVTEAQREPLLRWLDAHAPPDRWGSERLLPALVAGSLWMLTGSALSVASAADPQVTALAFGAAGALQVGLGVAARRFGQVGVAVGAESAGMVVIGASAGWWQLDGRAALGVGATLALAGAVLGGRVASRAVGLAALFGGVVAAGPWFDRAVTPGEGAATAVVALGSMGAAAAAFRSLPGARPADGVVLFPTILLLRLSWEASRIGALHQLGAGAAAASLGVLALGLGSVARSGGFVAAGVVSLLVAELYTLDGVNDPQLALGFLGLEGLVLGAAVLTFVVWRIGRDRRPPPEPR